MGERLESDGLLEHVSAALITFTDDDRLDAYVERRDVVFPILRDADRSTYRAYGLGRGSLRRVWGRDTLARYVEILRPSGPGRGLSDLHRTDEDTRQLGGDFVVAADGTLSWAHRSTGPADRPDPTAIVSALHGALRNR